MMAKTKTKVKEKVGVKRAGTDSKGRWLPGTSGNLKGRPVSPNTKLGKLLAAIMTVEAKHDLTVLESFIERSYDDASIAIALMKKLHPDLKAIEVSPGHGFTAMGEEEAAAIQDKLRARLGTNRNEQSKE